MSDDIAYGRQPCACTADFHGCRLVAITGGPGAGKTAILDIARQVFCRHVAIVPEAATIVFSGGFWRGTSDAARRAAQRAIFQVQRQLETMLVEDGLAAVGLCDRGTIDGLAYWPGDEGSFWTEFQSTRASELSRYAAVVHLRTPPPDAGYNRQNPVRIESARRAAELDSLILAAWEGHPRRVIIEADASFDSKMRAALGLIRELLPRCCSRHSIDVLAADSV